jgi:Chloramphenicol phosphotransferase-like protein
VFANVPRASRTIRSVVCDGERQFHLPDHRPMAAGKSTVARLLAERFARTVHLEGDVFRRSIVSGRVEMTPDPSAEALDQLRLRYSLAAAAAETYAAHGFTVVVEDVVAGPLLPEFLSLIDYRPLYVVVLLPSVDALASRDEPRSSRGYGIWSAPELRAVFVDETPRLGLWIDSTDQTPAETVEAVIEHTRDAAVG